MAPPARRVTLHPPGDLDDAALTDVAMRLPEALTGEAVGVGDEVTVGDTRLVVTGTEPGTRAPVAADTAFTIEPRAPRARRRLVFDVLFLVDASWSMGRERKRRFAPIRYVAPAIEPFQRQCGDFVRSAALATFNREAVLDQTFGALDALEPERVEKARTRGPTRLAPALDFALATLGAHADARNRHAIVLFTDDDASTNAVQEAAKRAARLEIPVHVVDLGDEAALGLQLLAKRAGGTYVHAPWSGTLGPTARAMAHETETPFTWEEPPSDEEDGVDFEIVLRSIPDAEA